MCSRRVEPGIGQECFVVDGAVYASYRGAYMASLNHHGCYPAIKGLAVPEADPCGRRSHAFPYSLTPLQPLI